MGLGTLLVSIDDKVLWGKDLNTEIGYRQGGSVLAHDYVPYSFLCAIPPQFAFALSRAAVTTQLGTKEFGQRFEAILKAASAAKGESSS